jgi:hypothetical protein
LISRHEQNNPKPNCAMYNCRSSREKVADGARPPELRRRGPVFKHIIQWGELHFFRRLFWLIRSVNSRSGILGCLVFPPRLCSKYQGGCGNRFFLVFFLH